MKHIENLIKEVNEVKRILNPAQAGLMAKKLTAQVDIIQSV